MIFTTWHTLNNSSHNSSSSIINSTQAKHRLHSTKFINQHCTPTIPTATTTPITLTTQAKLIINTNSTITTTTPNNNNSSNNNNNSSSSSSMPCLTL